MRAPTSLTSSSSSKPLYGSSSSASSTTPRSKCIAVVGICCLLVACILAAVLSLTISTNDKHKQEDPPHPLLQSPSTSAPSPRGKDQPHPLLQSPRSVRIPEAEIIAACKATRSPGTCKSSLAVRGLVPPEPTPLDIIQSAMLISAQNLKTVRDELRSVLSSSASNQNITKVAKVCVEVLGYSQARISQANESLPRGDVKSTRSWMSAALSYVYDCSGGMKHYTNDTSMINETMSHLVNLLNYTSNALSMVVAYDLYGNGTAPWRPPRTERDGFFERGGAGQGQGSIVTVPRDLKEDAVVCRDGANGCYKTVQEAVDAAPSNLSDTRFVIRIKEGVYEEIVRVPFDKKNVVFLGDGRNKTVITGSLTVATPGITTYDSAIVGVLGDGFMASGLTIRNTAGPPTYQAVAFRSDSDRSIIEDCEFLGNQDTLYAHSLRQYYKSCRIQGNIDFIFGNAAAVFEDCLILVKPRLENPEQGEQNVITASGRVDPAQSTGFVFLNCSINATQEYMALYNSKPNVHVTYLGRPWKEYARTVYINCIMAAVITPEGWMPWSGDFALNTLFFGESGNSGPGSNTSQRVSWSSQFPSQYVNAYSVQNFIQGEDWNPASR